MFGALVRFAFIGILIPLAFGSLAGLLAVMLPLRLRRATECIAVVPVNAGMIGLLTLIAASAAGWLWDVSLVLVFPVIFAPVVLILSLVLLAGLCFGWVVVSEVIGKIVLARFGVYTPALVSTTVGATLLTLIIVISALIPVRCVGGLTGMLIFLLSCVGLGAFVLTRAGSRSYPAKTVRRIETL
jgi:hypothetical protein